MNIYPCVYCSGQDGWYVGWQQGCLDLSTRQHQMDSVLANKYVSAWVYLGDDLSDEMLRVY